VRFRPSHTQPIPPWHARVTAEIAAAWRAYRLGSDGVNGDHHGSHRLHRCGTPLMAIT
jgi:hypothetical protein